MSVTAEKDTNGKKENSYKKITESAFEEDKRMLAAIFGDEFDDEDVPSFSEEESDGPSWIPSPTFVQKILRADETIQKRYDEIKNYALRFKRLKTRISKKFDSINKGRLHFVKLTVTGKALKLYLNMDIKDVDPKFHCVDAGGLKTFKTVPVMLRIKSDRAMGYAKTLIDQCAALHGLKENKKFREIDAMAMVNDFLYGQGEEEEE